MQSIYIVGYDQQYECGGTLRLCSNYDKAFAYLEELVKQDGEEWVDDYFRVIPNTPSDIERGRGEKHWIYRKPKSADAYYTITIRPLY